MTVVATLPTNVRIGALDYAVVLRQGEYADELGSCNPDTLRIFIRDDLHAQKAVEVLIHEILHGCYDGAGLAKGGKLTEERIVDGLGYQIVQVMRDNPDLLKFIGDVFGHGDA
jgi:hypothetical protein